MITQSLADKEILLKEIHHRVKNNLQFVLSLLSLQSRQTEDQTAHAALKEGQNRIKSMAVIHQNLYQEDNLTGIEVKDYFERLATGLFNSYNISPDRIRLNTEIQDVHLDVDTFIPLGLIVNELVSNSLKHAFGPNDQGIITVSLKELGDQLELCVSDDGFGMPDQDSLDLQKSFGFRLINAFIPKLDASLIINGQEGTEVKLEIKKYEKVA